MLVSVFVLVLILILILVLVLVLVLLLVLVLVLVSVLVLVLVFKSDLREAIKRVPTDDRLILVGDLNARVSSDTEKWKGVPGSHGVGKCNANEELLLALCSEYNLMITNILYKHKDTQEKTWMHPRSNY